jgi:hypothetical protein
MPFLHDKARDMIINQPASTSTRGGAGLRAPQNEFIGIRSQFPDTHIPDGRPRARATVD